MKIGLSCQRSADAPSSGCSRRAHQPRSRPSQAIRNSTTMQPAEDGALVRDIEAQHGRHLRLVRHRSRAVADGLDHTHAAAPVIAAVALS